MKIVIKGRLPGLNEYIAEERTHRQRGATMKRKAEEVIRWSIRSQVRGKVKPPVHLRYVFYEINRKRDKDNIAGFAHKVIQDSLVKEKVLHNDGWDYIEDFEDAFFVDEGNPRIEVYITEVGNE